MKTLNLNIQLFSYYYYAKAVDQMISRSKRSDRMSVVTIWYYPGTQRSVKQF